MHVEPHMDRDRLVAHIRAERSAVVRTRLRMVRLAMDGKTIQEIADQLCSTTSTVHRWIRQYNAKGPKGLLPTPTGRTSPFLEHSEADIVESIKSLIDSTSNKPVSIAGIRKLLEEEYGIQFGSNSGCRHALARLGIRRHSKWVISPSQAQKAR